MRRALVRLLILSLLFYSLPVPQATAGSSLVIGEINWAGSSLSSADEWIELWNLTMEPISLHGYQLTGASGNRNLLFGINDRVLGGAVFLISNYDASDMKSVLNIAPHMVTSSLSLPNDHLLIELRDSTGALIDQAGNGATPPAGLNEEPKSSMIRAAPSQAGDDPTAWITATSSQNFDVGVQAFGTPGWCDGCLTQSAVTSTIVPSDSTSTSSANTQGAPSPPAVQDYGPQHPIASFSVSGEFQTSSTLEFDAASSSDPNGDILNFKWDFGDGSAVATGTHATHEYATSSDFTISLIASDGTFFDTATTSLTIAPQPTEPPPPPPSLPVRLNEIFSSPSNGAEWVELSALTVMTTPDLQGWQLEDAKGVIFRFTSSTWNVSSSYLQIELKGSHLNNDGDIVRLRDPYGRVIDESAYADLQKNQSWIRSPDHVGEWHVSEMPTPGQPNIWVPPLPKLERRPSNDETSPIPRRITIVKQVTQKIAPKISVLPFESSAPQDIQKEEIVTEEEQKEDLIVPEKKVTPKLPKAKKPSTPLPRSTTIPMLPQFASDTHVELTGFIATVPKLLGRHQFVIQTEDGRGLFVQGNGKQTSPPLGMLVRLRGILLSNDDGLSLRMKSQDQWRSVPSPQKNIQPRLVDFFNPSQEDAWSLVETTGTVREINRSSFQLDTGEMMMTVLIRPVVHYRAERLTSGDVIRVRGLLDTRGEDSKILPRQAGDIFLIKHAEKKSANPSRTNGLPPWTPIGSAGLTVALAHGIKYLRKRQKQQQLAKRLAEASKTLSTQTS